MKTFTELDKKIITWILDCHEDGKTNCLYNIIFDNSEIFDLVYNFQLCFKDKDVTLWFKNDYIKKMSENDVDFFPRYCNGITTKFTQIVTLLDYLTSNGYLVISGVYGDYLPSDTIPGDDYTEHEYKDTLTKERLSYYAIKKLIPSPELINLRKNKYKDAETLKDDENKRDNRKMMIVAIVSLAITFFSAIYPVIKDYQDKDKRNTVYIENEILKAELVEPEAQKCQSP